MDRFASIYLWLFVGAIFIAINILILNDFGSRLLYAEESNPAQVRKVLQQALQLSRNLEKKSREFDVGLITLARDPFDSPVLPAKSKDSKYSSEKKFFKAPALALQLPHIDGILTIKKLDGTEFRYLLVKGKLIRIGDSIDGFQVVKVLPDSVLMRAKGKEFKIAFSQGNYNVAAENASRKNSSVSGELAME